MENKDKPITAEWIDQNCSRGTGLYGEFGYEEPSFTCSKCGYHTNYKPSDCPNCHATMLNGKANQ